MVAPVHRPIRKVAICAPATPLKRKYAEAVLALAAEEFPDIALHFHEQCFVEDGHFAGADAVRLGTLLECANDAAFDAVWFAKGGYGSNRIAANFIGRVQPAAREKAFLGYSDMGFLLGALYRAGIGKPIHAPMPVDVKREGGEEAIRRVLCWMAGEDAGLEPSLSGRPVAAFNLYTLAMLVGTQFMPSLDGHEVLIEEVGEYEYAIDRLMFHLVEHMQGVAGIRLGEVTAVPENDRPFGANAEEIVRGWCERYGIEYLGRAAIGHTSDNRIVPFGLEACGARA
ncbi:LD-carboxypeptidase [Erythrobacter sp. SD-21]|uniref:LD-carboxypeptidase n=1 Tax=Erythrobacter sp. SD-21 TaxID=161528 RepID=UPI000153F572|nr:peptidase U61, LD-carboxypeptidase A [Erythrobacter sp. SD-21]